MVRPIAMSTSDKGRALLTQWEDKRALSYRDSGGKLTIGVGHLLTKSERASGKILIAGRYVKYSGGLSDTLIDKLLSADLRARETVIGDSVEVELNQDQYDALVSFVFNVGRSAFKTSKLLRLLNAGDYESVPDQLRRWKYDDGKVNQGLVNRRENEVKLWEGRI